jgi:hypothetical protein
MPQIVVAPNGDEVEFPDGTPDDQIVQVMKREYAPAQPVIRATPVEGGSFQAGGLNGPSVVPAGSTPDPQTAQDPTRLKTLANTINQGLYGGASGLARIFQSAIPETATSPLDVSVRKGLGYFAEETDKSAQQIQEGFNVNPAAKDIPSQIARGAGTVATALPFGVAGIGQLGASVYNQAFNKAVSEGKSDTEARNEAAVHLEKEVPKLAAFAVGGKVASALVGKIASPLVRGLAGTAVGTAVNTTVGSAAKALEGEDWRPNAESLTMDALFGLVHGFGEHANATAEVRQRAADELKARGIPEEAVAPAVEPSEAQGRSVPQSEVKTPPSEQATPSTAIPEVVVPEAQVKVTPEGITDLQTGEPISPIREQSLKSLGVIPEVRTETALEPMERDAFERTSGETLEEGNVAYRDPQTRQVFQAPEKATPEELKGIVDAARLEEESAQRRARMEEHDLQVEEARLAKSREEVGQVPVPKPVEVQQNDYLWNNPLRLKNLRDEMVMQDKKAKAGTLSIGGEKVKPNPRFESTLKEIDSRIQFLMSPEALEEAPRTLTPLTVRAEEPVQPGERAQTPPPEVSGRQMEPVQLDEAPSEPTPEPVVAPELQPESVNTPTSIKNEVVDRERQARGLTPLTETISKEIGKSWSDAMELMDADPQYQQRLINSLKNQTRPLNDVDTAVLLHRQVELQNAYDRELKKVVEAYEKGDEQAVTDARTNQLEIQAEYDKLTQLGKEVGTEQGRALRFRQTMVNEDFSLARMEMSMRAEKGGAPLSPEESAKVQELHDKIKSTEDAFEKYKIEAEDRISRLESQNATEKIVRRVHREVQPKGQVERANQWLKSKADQARERIRARKEQGQVFSGGVNPEEIDDYIIIGASKLAEGISNAAQWSSAMVAEFGETIRPYLKNLFEKAKAVHADAPKQLTNEEQRTRIMSGIQTRVQDGDGVESLGPYIQQLAENAVRGGIKEREPLVKAVHEVLKDVVPNITEREVQDAISGYGKFKPLSQDEVKVTLRDLKGQLQQVSKIEDLQQKIAPKKTGLERREKSAEERRLEKQVNELKKAGGYSVTNPETQLKTALGAIKTRLRNQIQDLDLALTNRQPIPNKKGGVPYDSEALTLKAQRDSLKEQYDSIFQKPGLTEEQQLRAATSAVERSIKEYEDRIKTGELQKRAGKPGPTSPQLEALKARRDALKAELEDLRSTDSLIQEQRTQESLQRSIETLESRLASGSPEKAPVQGPESLRVSELGKRRDEVSKRLAELRQSSPEALQRRTEKTVEALEKSIAEYDRRLKEGDFSKRATKAPVNTPETEALRSERDAMRKLYEEIVRSQKPKLTPEEAALKSYKARLLAQTAKLKEAMATGNLEQKARPEVKLDQQAINIRAENTAAKEEFNKALFELRLKNRSPWRKFADTGRESLNAARALMTSFDLSAVLRQGGFIGFGNPVRAAKALPAMFKALRSENAQRQVMEEIRARKNYQDGTYDKAKLFLSDEGSNSLTKMEEAYMSRWASKIPGVAASQRAYTTFLNKLRADSFDAMVETLTRSGTPTTQELRAIGNFINVATGRGNLGAAAQAAVGLNTAFFAPRYVLSRFQLLAGQPLYGGTARTRGLVAKEYAKVLAGAAIVYGLGQAAGATIEKDPRSSDFGKLKFGNTRVDPLFGLIQNTVLLSRLLSGTTKTSQGKVVPIRGDKVPYGTGNSADVVFRYLRTKLSPLFGTALNVASGKDVTGQPVTAKDAAIGAVVPITFQDIKKVMEAQGIPKGTIFTLLSLFGAGVQTYDQKKKGSDSSGDFFSKQKKDDFFAK